MTDQVRYWMDGEGWWVEARAIKFGPFDIEADAHDFIERFYAGLNALREARS